MNEYDLSQRPSARDRLSDPDTYPVRSVAVHPRFDRARLRNNVAVLRLRRRVGLASGGAAAACLPQCRGMFDYQFANGTGTRCGRKKSLHL